MAIIEEKIKKFKAKSKVIKAQKMEDTAKLDFALAKIEALKRKVYESQYEVVSLIKKVKTSNNHQKLIAKPWNRPTCSSWGVRDANQFLDTQVKHYVQEAQR